MSRPWPVWVSSILGAALCLFVLSSSGCATTVKAQVPEDTCRRSITRCITTSKGMVCETIDMDCTDERWQ